MDKRIAVVGIILDDTDRAEEVNNVLHQYGEIIVGRMGLPYKERGCSVISVIVEFSPGLLIVTTNTSRGLPASTFTSLR